MANKLGEIQALRALAIFYVLLYHLNENWIPLGFLGVDMFFVISGYLMARIFYDKENSWRNSLTFFERRFKRIMPCYGLMILCVVLVGRLCLTKIDRENLFVDAFYSLGIISNMQSLFTTVDYFELISEYKFLTHTWSLSAEMQFYLFVPLIFWLLRTISDRNKYLTLAIMAIISAIAEVILPTSIGFGLLLCRLWQFVFGISIHVFYKPPRVSQKEVESLLESDDTKVSKSFPCKSGESERFIYMSFFLCMVIPFLFFVNVGIPRLLTIIAATGLIHFSQGEVETLLSSRPLQYVGDISYVVYLVHWPVIAFYRNIWLLDELELSDYTKLFFVISLTSIAVHHFIEQYFLTSDSKLCLNFTLVCYLLAAICIFMPISNTSEAYEPQNVKGFATTKDCESLRIYPKLANFENYVKDGDFKESYGELRGNDSFEVMVVGNSYLKSYQAYAEKPFRGKYSRFYMMARGMCTPFVNYDELNDLTHDFQLLTEGCEEYNEYLFTTVEKIRPKILLMILGLGKPNEMLATNWNKMIKTARSRIKRVKKASEYLLITLPMYYLSNSVAHNYNRIVESGKGFPPRNETMYLYKDYVTQSQRLLRMLNEVTKDLSNIFLVDVQAPFCEDGVTCDLYDYECNELMFDWGGRHPTTFARNRVEAVLRMNLDQVYNLLEAKPQ